jgi:CRP/FNR family transcriptional regulator, cyclic AMP receptor protein
MPFFDAAYAASDRPVRLLDADVDLSERVSDSVAPRSAELTVATLSLQPGSWTPDADVVEASAGLLVFDGVLVRTVRVARQRSSELIGEGDLIFPRDPDQPLATVAFDVEWDVLQPAELGILDDAFFATACRFPEVNAALMMRCVQRSHRLALQLAIGDLRRIDDRMIALFLHLGDRWGRMTSEGIYVPLRLTHDLIAQLLGAQRPTVTTSLNDLQRAGRLARRPDRSWIVRTAALKRSRAGR